MTQQSPSSQPPEKDSKAGWVERIAKQSSGVEAPKTVSQPTESDVAEQRRLWRLGGLGLQFAGTIALFWFIGSRLDAYFGWPGVATLTAIIIAILGNTYLLIKEAIKANKS